MADEVLYGKTCELRANVERWLTYIPSTFAHYTSHTIDHSDEIVLQVSRILFAGRRKKPALGIGPVGAYTLVASAYLHDAGMVVSEQEKLRILSSEEWHAWTSTGSGAARWTEIEARRKNPDLHADEIFALDTAVRHLLAEYIRRQHHMRAGEFVRGRAIDLGRIDLGDPALARLIANVCVAHGLDSLDLEDDERFPEATDVLGETVNVRLIATLLRLGDLLDLRYARACPLLLQAASPLPPESLAHWTQYGAILTRHTSPEAIKITASCRSQEEHRLLHDWCTWISKEVERIPARLPRTKWVPPHATMTGKGATIQIRRAPDAPYLSHDWSMTVDNDLVLRRLIEDVYDTPDVFLRELIQNAADALRCRMYAEHAKEGPALASPARFPLEVRQNYFVNIRIHTEQAKNELSGELEQRHVVTVEDNGIGMSAEIVTNFLLQVGRSYYATEHFRRRFAFNASSRFGLGFLSVFGVSDHIVVDTYMGMAGSQEQPLRLTLAGPRNYVLTEPGTRLGPGTTITVRMRHPMKETLTNLVRDWCAMLEFSVHLNEYGNCSTIEPFAMPNFGATLMDSQDRVAEYFWRAHSIEHPGIEGAIYVLIKSQAGKETWLTSFGAHREAPFGQRIPFPERLRCFHGLAYERGTPTDMIGVEVVDIRGQARSNLGRTKVLSEEVETALRARYEEALAEHLGPEDPAFDLERWTYRMRLSSRRGPGGDRKGLAFWCRRADMVPYWRGGTFSMLSAEAIWAEGSFVSQLDGGPRPRDDRELSLAIPRRGILLADCFTRAGIWGGLWERLMCSATLVEASVVGSQQLIGRWRATAESGPPEKGGTYDPLRDNRFLLIDVPDYDTDIVLWGHGPRTAGWAAVNVARPFGAWLKRLRGACKLPGVGIRERDVYALQWQCRAPAPGDREPGMAEFLARWRKTYPHPSEFECPDTMPTWALQSMSAPYDPLW